MRTEKDSKLKPRKKTIRRLLKVGLGLLFLLIVLLLLLAPTLISSDKGRRIILAKINASLAGETDFADLSMGWLDGIKVADFRFSDEAGRLSVQAGQIATKPHYASVLTGNLSFGATTIDRPRVAINLRDTSGAKVATSEQEPPAGPAVQPVALPIKTIELALNDGNLKVTDPKSGTVELSHINSRLNLRPPGQQTDFDLRMAVAQAGTPSAIQLAGRVTPTQKEGWSFKGTNGDLTVEVNDLDVESLGPLLALAGVDIQAKGRVAGQLLSEIKEGRIENLNAELKAKNLDVTGAVLKGDRLQTADLEIRAALSQGTESINIENLHLKSDWASASADGTVPMTFKSFGDLLDAGSSYDLKGQFNCDLARLASQMPRTLGLKEGMQVTSGQLRGNVATSTAAGRRQIQASATLSRLEGVLEGKKIALSDAIKAEALVSSGKAGMNFDRIDVTAPFAEINCAGSIESLTYNAETDLTKLQSELGQFIDIGPYKLAGQFAGKGQVSIKDDKITTTGSSTLSNLRVDAQDGNSVSEPKAQIDTAVDIDRKNSVVSIRSATAGMSFGRFGVKDGVLSLNKESPQASHLAISASGVDLAKLKPFAVIFASFPQEVQLAGIADSQILVNAEKNIYKITTDSARIRGFALTYPGQKPFEPNDVTLTLDAEIVPGQKAINVKKLELDSPQIKIRKGQFSRRSTGERIRLEGLAECEYDWGAVTTMVAPYLPEGLALQGKRTDAINFLSEYPITQPEQLLSNLTAGAQVGFEQAGYMGLDFGPTDVNIQIDNGLLKVAPFQTTVNEGQFSFAAQGDFKRKPALFTTPGPMQLVKDIKVNDKTTAQLLKYVNPIFANAVNVSGIANFNCEQLAIPISAEAKNDAVVIGTISISQLRLQASDLLGQILTAGGPGGRAADMTMHPTRFVLKDGFLRYDNMQIDVGDNPVNFKGVIGLDRSLDMTVTLPYTSEGRTVRVGRQSAGRRITLPLKGTVDAPQLDTGKLLEEQLKDQIEEELRRGLEEIFR
ncbi:MAG: hypothetical protein JSW66_10300 [Phycisphaerales bacterium]|nr:MAG: hypothetical protein JSW66_10300 [Phycisphaerales bacterium]